MSDGIRRVGDLDVIGNRDGVARPDVSLVIPARNAGQFFGEALQALCRQEFDGSWEVVVVDNQSTDDTVQIAADYAERFPELRVVSCSSVGINCARNAGVRAARGEKVVICDADDVVGEGWLSAIVTGLDSSDVVGGRLVTSELNAGLAGVERIGLGKTKLAVSLGHLPYATGANMGFHRAVFEAIDGFDEDFGRGATEVDFCWRAQYAGFRIAFVPDAVVHYRLRPTMGSFARQYYGYSFGTARLYSKHLAMGRLPSQSKRRKSEVLVGHLRALGRVDLLLYPSTRWDYARRVARFAGSLHGYWRFHTAV